MKRRIQDIDDDGVLLRDFVKEIDDKPKEIVWKPKDIFLKVYVEELKKIRNKINATDMIFCFEILPYISYASGMLTKTGKNDKRCPLKLKDIMDVTGYSKNTVRDCLNRLVNVKVLSKTKVGRQNIYYANPHIFFKGRTINETLISMFKDYKEY